MRRIVVKNQRNNLHVPKMVEMKKKRKKKIYQPNENIPRIRTRKKINEKKKKNYARVRARGR